MTAALARAIGAGLAAVALFVFAPAQAQAPAATLDADARAAVVEGAAEALRERYVFPDVGEQAAAAIEAALAAGRYDGLADPHAFADRLTEDLRAVTHDKHMGVRAAGPPPAGAGASAPPPPPSSEAGVTRADRLADDIGYIEVIAFPPLDIFKPAVDRALAPLADTRALVVDIRRNGGGDPASVSHLVSYFLDGAAPIHINSFVSRTPGTETFTTQEFWSTTPPFTYAGKPVFVLTSPQTFSGGEEFAYDMQVLALATLIGETTGGGANPTGGVPLAHGLAISVPFGRAENPVTGTNWEGVGVTPDLDAPSAQALRVALEQLGQSPTADEIDALSEERLFEPRSTPQPGSEAAVRRMIDELARGEPDYALLSDGLAQATREQLPRLQEMFSGLGAVESVTFQSVDAIGADVYDVRLANGAVTWMIVLAPDGTVAMSGVRPAAAPPGGNAAPQ